jgi:hypothetical protein
MEQIACIWFFSGLLSTALSRMVSRVVLLGALARLLEYRRGVEGPEAVVPMIEYLILDTKGAEYNYERVIPDVLYGPISLFKWVVLTLLVRYCPPRHITDDHILRMYALASASRRS